MRAATDAKEVDRADLAPMREPAMDGSTWWGKRERECEREREREGEGERGRVSERACEHAPVDVGCSR